MASGPCLRRCLAVRRYMPIRLQFYRLDVKSYPLIHVSMYFEPFWEGNAVNTGVPCLKVPMHRKLGYARGSVRTPGPALGADAAGRLGAVARRPARHAAAAAGWARHLAGGAGAPRGGAHAAGRLAAAVLCAGAGGRR